jgi:hypothetical protein
MFQKGGVRISKLWVERNPGTNNIGDIIEWFLTNSELSLLTNSSISCVTLRAKLRDDVPISPFTSMTRKNFQKSVRSILVKVFVTYQNIYVRTTGMYEIPGRSHYNGIEITTYDDFQKEVYIQRDIYQKSFRAEKTAFEPICPTLIASNYGTSSDDSAINQLFNSKFLKVINDKFTEDGGYISMRPLGNSDDEIRQINEVLRAGKRGALSTSFVFMEFLDGFDTISNTFGGLVPESTQLMVRYTLLQMHKLGYIHGDAHSGNFMINPNYQLFTKDKTSPFLGKVLVIDFGRSTRFGKAMERPDAYQPLNEMLDSENGVIRTFDRAIRAQGIEFKRGLIKHNQRWFSRDNPKNRENLELLKRVLVKDSSIDVLNEWYINYIGEKYFLGGYKKIFNGGLIFQLNKKPKDSIVKKVEDTTSVEKEEKTESEGNLEKEEKTESESKIELINFDNFYSQISELTYLDFLKNIKDHFNYFVIDEITPPNVEKTDEITPPNVEKKGGVKKQSKKMKKSKQKGRKTIKKGKKSIRKGKKSIRKGKKSIRKGKKTIKKGKSQNKI